MKNCLNCKKELVIKCKRDIARKNYCSHSCRQSYRLQDKDYKEKLMKSMWSKCNTPEANKKKSHPGETNPKYIKDRTQLKTRKRYENSEWKKQVFIRDNYTCQICDQKGGKLQADHIKPYCAYPELRTDINNGRTLCITCHKKTDTYGSKAIKFKEAI